MNAYDYGRQVWVTGEEARALLIEQTEDTLALLLSERGQGYADMMGKDLAGEIESARSFLTSLREVAN